MVAGFLASACGLLLSVVIGRVSCIPRTDSNLKTYVVDLDDEPRQRWNNVLLHFDANILREGIDDALKLLNVTGALRSLSIKIAGDLDKYIPHPYADEMRGISDFWEIDLGYIVLANILYDIAANKDVPIGLRACTSIVTMDQGNHILHGRNLDYFFPNLLSKMVTKIEFQKNEKTLFYSISYAGQVAPPTGYKPGKFSLTLNQRNEGRWWQNLISGLEGHMPTFFYFREVMEKADSYDSAIQMLKGMKTVSPVYLIIGGIKPYEGAVVIGNRHGVVIETMNDTLQHGWYIVETNYDPWDSPPPDDNRRGMAIKLMEKHGQMNMNETTLSQILATPPILDINTVYTTLMRAGDPKIFDTILISHSGIRPP